MSGSLKGITASHCSSLLWERDSTVWMINNKRSMYESADPAAASCPLLQQYYCHRQRGSDANVMSFYPDSVPDYAFGRLARPAVRALDLTRCDGHQHNPG